MAQGEQSLIPDNSDVTGVKSKSLTSNCGEGAGILMFPNLFIIELRATSN
jgi:hypothetical protein